MKEIIINSPKHGQKIVLVDDEDYERLHKFNWQVVKNRQVFYATRCLIGKKNNRKNIKMHREIMAVNEKNIIVDHRDHNGLNNQRNNLRIATHSGNMANRIKRATASSKYLGVSFNPIRNNWKAVITKNRKRYRIGTFENEIDAAIAYNNKAAELHGEFANLNNI